ncbi:unnamed protein product [Urochloa humidicola]
MSPGDIVLCSLYVLLGAFLLVLMICAIFDLEPPLAAEGGVNGGPPQLTFPGVGPPGALASYPRAMAASPVPDVALPYFPYLAARGGPPSSGGQASSETMTVGVCAICLDPLRRGQLCRGAGVPAHVPPGLRRRMGKE